MSDEYDLVDLRFFAFNKELVRYDDVRMTESDSERLVFSFTDRNGRKHTATGLSCIAVESCRRTQDCNCPGCVKARCKCGVLQKHTHGEGPYPDLCNKQGCKFKGSHIHRG